MEIHIAYFFYVVYGAQETNQKLRNDTGIMRKKFTSLQKEIDDHKDEIRKYQAEISKLNAVIRNLEKDIVGLKKEIQERDETIQDKVRLFAFCDQTYQKHSSDVKKQKQKNNRDNCYRNLHLDC